MKIPDIHPQPLKPSYMSYKGQPIYFQSGIIDEEYYATIFGYIGIGININIAKEKLLDILIEVLDLNNMSIEKLCKITDVSIEDFFHRKDSLFFSNQSFEEIKHLDSEISYTMN